jgi:DNA (cytosine-5)-methyltransferase 1
LARKILVADLLCGAGGSSTGCQRALEVMGLKMELVCVNHWGVAIETHKKNHPEARHYVQDIATVRPHLLVPEGYLDLLMASPTCTHHSVARGGKPTSDQQRSDPWHIITWLTELRVKRLIIENVWEFCGWGPVDPRTGKPIKSARANTSAPGSTRCAAWALSRNGAS